ncbi:MAG: hypothetical protein ACFE7R_09520 [Candidatus Hodarchaeota archaeon]
MPVKDYVSVHELKDPLHGYIYLSDLERRIMDMRLTQRIRQIRSPAGIHLVYPGADTSYMGRMLGFIHMTETMMEYLGADEDDIAKGKLCAMIIALSTGPWANVMDEYLSIRGLDKLDFAKLIIQKSAAGEAMAKEGFSKTEMVNAVTKGVPLRTLRLPLYNSPISPQLIDSLQRDAYFAGVEYAQLEYHRLFDATRVAKNKIAVERGVLFTLESYLSAAGNMFDAVYYHKTVRAAELMLLRILDEAGSQLFKSPKEDLDTFLNLDDISFMDFLLRVQPDDSQELKSAGAIYTDFKKRYLIKLSAERSVSDPQFLNRLQTTDGVFKLEEEIAEDAGIDPQNVYIDYPDRMSVTFHPGKLPLDDLVLFERSSKGYEFWSVEDMSSVARSFVRHLKLIRIYTTRGYRAKVRKVGEKLLESIDSPGDVS